MSDLGKVVLAIILTQSWMAHSNPNQFDCDLETIKKFCETLKSKEKTQLRSKSPYKFSNGETMPSVDSISGSTIEFDELGRTNIPWGKMQRLEKLFKQTQKYSQEAIRNGRRMDALSAEEKNLISRIQTMKLSKLQSSRDQEVCKSNFGYAYDPSSHSLIMCPEMAGYPKSSIVWTMGAFIGRGLGSCATSFPKASDTDPKAVMGVISPSKHPFNNLKACLIQGGYPDAPGGIDFNKPEVKAIVDSQISQSFQTKSPSLPESPKTLADALKSEKNLAWAKEVVSDFRECLPEQTNARVDSGIQDWFGSEVVARYLEDQPLQVESTEDHMQPLAVLVDFSCRSPKSAELTQKFHVPLDQRLESAVFSNPRLRRALNCSPKVPAKQVCSIGEAQGTLSPRPQGPPTGDSGKSVR